MNKINKQEIKNKTIRIIGTIIKSLVAILIICVSMILLADLGSFVYRFKVYNESSRGMFGSTYNLNIFYGTIGIILYVLINYLGFKTYDFFTKKFKNYLFLFGRILFITSSLITNYVMLILYWQLFDIYSFENPILEFLNSLVIRNGFILFPFLFTMIYIKQKRKEIKKHELNK